MEYLLSAAGIVTKKKVNYQRSWKLSEPGGRLYFWKAVLSAKYQNAILNIKTKEQAELIVPE